MDADFFEPTAPPPEPERWEPPQWFQPPTDEFAALVADRRLLARTDRGVVILLSHIDVFSTGCMLRVRVSVHNRERVEIDGGQIARAADAAWSFWDEDENRARRQS